MLPRLPAVATILLLAPIACGDEGPIYIDFPEPAHTQQLGPVTCDPDARICLDEDTRAICNPEGDGYLFTQNCKSGHFCDPAIGACATYACDAGETRCLGPNNVQSCALDRLSWRDPEPCEDEHLCVGDHCVYERCIASVLLLVDRSGSMTSHWVSVTNGVYRLMKDNPKARFGVSGFPTDDTCAVVGASEVPLDINNQDAVFHWFKHHTPNGGTPLLDAYRAIVDNADDIFDGGGNIVVLSDGEDTCSWPALDPVDRKVAIADELANLASELTEAHDVRSYVIGYAFDGDPIELDAIAAHGGTNLDAHLRAGNEAELSDLFKGIVTDFKLCF